ncbi:hypothetical protein [Providencia rustigianii]|uniref:hypothetical protein n=1 Tax=Providencia rustigianii TaxID=158850 RepID=UPI0038B30686
MYYILGAVFGFILFYLDLKLSKKPRTNWGVIPFAGIAVGTWEQLSPSAGDYEKYVYLGIALIISFVVIRVIVRVSREANVRYQRLQNEGSSKFTALLKVIVGSLLATCLVVGFFIDMRIFFGAFVLVFIFNIIENTPKKRFLKFQKSLATSKIRSMAMGLVEVEGQITQGTEIKSRLGKRSCYGSFYYEYSISKDKDGKKSYTLQDSKVSLNDFTITDDTGSAKVICDPDYFVHAGLTPHMDFEQGNRRYKEILIEGNVSYLLIGSVDSENGQRIITRKPPHLLLGISPSEYVTRWNKTAPMRKNLGITAIIAAILIVVILMTPSSYQDGFLTLHFNQISLFGSE